MKKERFRCADPLPSFNIDLAQTSVSGLSSGAYMAGQFHVAFSGTVVGAGIIAGGPYNCAEGQLTLVSVSVAKEWLPQGRSRDGPGTSTTPSRARL